MSRQFYKFLGAGLVAAAALVAFWLWWTRGAQIELRGAVQKVRTAAMDENSSVAVVDFRFVNPSDFVFVVRTVEVFLEDAGGKTLNGKVVSEVDAKRLFQYFPLLGQKYNETLLARTKIAARQSLDRMIAARFEVAEAFLQQRKNIRIRIEDVDGAVSEILEKPQ